jgi:GntR family trehalose operon transcriptional repressor
MKSIYFDIYESLRDRIEAHEFAYQSFIPSEARLAEEYFCSHNTVRKALEVLKLHGYVQPIQGKGVRVIWQPDHHANFVLGDIESFKEAAERNGLTVSTKVRSFETIIADGRIADLTGFREGDLLYHVERIRYLDGKALIHDINFFLASVVRDLTPQIVESSIYDYLEGTLGVRITTSKRTIGMENVTPGDRDALDLLEYSMVAVVTNHTFNEEGVMFETTFSRHRPDYFTFHDTAVRGY